MNYYLIGETLKHSFSKEIHNMLGNQNYSLLEIKKEDLPAFLNNKNFSGLNVTIPYKKAVIPYLNKIDDHAINIGAVNTVINKNGFLYGYNTDYYGLKELILKNNIVIKNKTVLILGSGGTSLTAKEVALSLGAKNILLVSRNKKENTITYLEAYNNFKNAQIIINTTPVGMYPNNFETPINLNNFLNLEAVVDVIYNPLNTKLVLKAKQKNINATGGIYMLIYQAAKAAELFFNKNKGFYNNKANEIYNNLLKQKQNLVLIGMAGSGKTTIGTKIAKILNKDFFDCDLEIAKEFGATPAQIIKTKGEEAFRTIESQMVNKLALKNNAVIATGGGAVLNNKNIESLKQNGKIIYLERPINLIIENNQNSSTERPLTKNAIEFEKVFLKRKHLYQNAADKTVICNNNLNQEIEDVKEAFFNEN